MFLRILAYNQNKGLTKVFRQIGVDPYGTAIMLPKAQNVIVKIGGLPSIAATILKQELLSIGGELAVPRDCISAKPAAVDCLLIATGSQLKTLNAKLQRQPFGLKNLCAEINAALANIAKERYTLKACNRTVSIGRSTTVMGIINITDDSFSGDGMLGCGTDPQALAERARQMVREGAGIIDIGAESSRPGARALAVKEELKRILPALKTVLRAVKVPVSVDTYKPPVARACLDNGACIINDITGMGNPQMRKLCARAKAGVVIMHMQGTPQNMQSNPRYADLMGELHSFFAQRIAACRKDGIAPDRIIIDPGIGFGKTLAHNLEILNRLAEFKQYGVPVLAGASRKRFIGTLSGIDLAGQRVHGSTASAVRAAASGAGIVRVHDVAATKQALAVGQAITSAPWSG